MGFIAGVVVGLGLALVGLKRLNKPKACGHKACHEPCGRRCAFGNYDV